MTPFYYLPVTSFDAWRQTGPIKKLLEGYFSNDGGFFTASVIAVAVAIVFSFAFYLMGRKLSLAKLSLWLTMFVLSGVVSFGVTAFSTGTLTETLEIGLAATFKKQKERIRDKEERNTYENTIKGVKSSKDRPVKDKKGQKQKAKSPNYLHFSDNPVVQAVSALNIIITMLLFWVFSLIFKDKRLKITKFAFYIPHSWPQRKNN